MKIKLLMLLCLLVPFGAAQAADSVAIAVYNVTAGALVENGNLYLFDNSDVPQAYRLQVYCENDVQMNGFSVGFAFTSPDGVGVTWNTQPDPAWGIHKYITVVVGSRMDPPLTVWDFGGMQVQETDVNGVLPDSILTGGLANAGGMVAGPLQHMFSWYFSLTGVADGETKQLYIDSTKIGPAGDFTYVDVNGSTITPKFGAKLSFSVTFKPSSDVKIDNLIPAKFELTQNHPNPFNPATKFSYSLVRKGKVNISVFNILGQKVTTLVDGERDAGVYEEVWTGQDDAGQAVASGVYFYKLVTDGFEQTRKMLLMK